MKIATCTVHCCVFLSLLVSVASSAEVTLKLKSTVALENSTVKFSCAGFSDENPPNVIITLSGSHSAKEECFTDLPVNISTYQAVLTGYEETIDGEVKMTVNIAIPATVANNKTIVKCTFNGDPSHVTGPKYLYVASDKLGSSEGFKVPKVASNSSAISVSWSPPWSHLVNSYTVSMVNKSSVDHIVWTDYDVGNKRSWTLSRSEDDRCEDIDIFVTASTDIGDTHSSIMHTGFPNKIQLNDTIQADNISIDVLERLVDNELVVKVSLKDHDDQCSHTQRILYNYTIMRNDSEIDCEGPTSTTDIEFIGSVIRNESYTLQLKYWENEKDHEFEILHKTFSVSPATVFPNCSVQESSTVTTTIIRTQLIEEPVHRSYMPERSSSDVMIVSCSPSSVQALQGKQLKSDWMPTFTTSALVVLAFTVMAIILTAAVCLIHRKNRRKIQMESTVTAVDDDFPSNCATETYNIPPFSTSRGRSKTLTERPSSCSTVKPMRRERRPSVPQVMATNPLYEGSSAIYSFLPDPSDLRALDNDNHQPPPPPPPVTSSQQAATNNEMYFEIPPQVPLPRKPTLDSPGVKAGIDQLSLDKGRNDLPDSNDQYVPMKSTVEQRYVKSPLSQKKTDMISDGKKHIELQFENNGNEKME